jgi:SAM-dependent methyltransferase
MSALQGLVKIFGEDDVGWIHDGVIGEERLRERGDWYIRQLFDPYPDLKLKPNFRALEIGSGVGYIMQALSRYGSSHGVPADRIIGLDIASPMLEKAKTRVGSGPPFEFLHYDGVHVPLEDGSLDFIYSVATLQHIPKEYVFNLFFEIKRLLSSAGFSLFHVMSFDHISVHHRPGGTPSWEEMVRNQIKSDGRTQWMHFYSEDELHQVLGTGTGFAHVRVTKIPGHTSFSVAVSNEPRPLRTDQLAAQTWNRTESLEETNRRIHDGVAGDEALMARATAYVRNLLFGNFPQTIPGKGAEILEIGSGVGWIMQAMNGYLSGLGVPPYRITGLDIAPEMSAKARERVGSGSPYDFQIYDGITIPINDHSFNLIYSVACQQHIPRPYVFNLFFEIRRLLKERGFAVVHFMSTDVLPQQEQLVPWRTEIDMQIHGRDGHWHHFYTRKELIDVFTITGFPYVVVADDGRGTLVACVSASPLALPEDFDPEAYLELNTDVRIAQANPATHYLEYGHAEGRKWFRDHRPVSKQMADFHFRERYCDLLVEREKLRAESLRIHEEMAKRFHQEMAEHLALEIARLQNEVSAMRTSTCWKMTAPIRHLVDFLRHR